MTENNPSKIFLYLFLPQKSNHTRNDLFFNAEASAVAIEQCTVKGKV
jgi:hypothetical protein